MDLKITAARQRRSVAAVVREKLGVAGTATNKEDLWERMDKFAKKIAKKYPNTRLSERLIEMRYS